MQISVIIPTHNRAILVQRALRSVLRQTVPAAEVIVIDDGSADNTEAVIRDRFPDVRYLAQANRGVSAARNHGIRAARHKWIAFLDADDEWLPEKLDTQINALTAAPEFRVCHSNEIWIRNGRRVNPRRRHEKSGGYIFQRCLPLCAISPSAVLIHRDVFEQAGLFDETLPACEDYDLWLRICARYPVLYVEKPLIRKYGGHPDQLSRRYPAMDRFRIYALEKILAGNAISTADRRAAREMLLRKIDIYLSGARKRGKNDEVAALSAKRRQLLEKG